MSCNRTIIRASYAIEIHMPIYKAHRIRIQMDYALRWRAANSKTSHSEWLYWVGGRFHGPSDCVTWIVFSLWPSGIGAPLKWAPKRRVCLSQSVTLVPVAVSYWPRSASSPLQWCVDAWRVHVYTHILSPATCFYNRFSVIFDRRSTLCKLHCMWNGCCPVNAITSPLLRSVYVVWSRVGTTVVCLRAYSWDPRHLQLHCHPKCMNYRDHGLPNAVHFIHIPIYISQYLPWNQSDSSRPFLKEDIQLECSSYTARHLNRCIQKSWLNDGVLWSVFLLILHIFFNIFYTTK